MLSSLSRFRSRIYQTDGVVKSHVMIVLTFLIFFFFSSSVARDRQCGWDLGHGIALQIDSRRCCGMLGNVLRCIGRAAAYSSRVQAQVRRQD